MFALLKSSSAVIISKLSCVPSSKIPIAKRYFCKVLLWVMPFLTASFRVGLLSSAI